MLNAGAVTLERVTFASNVADSNVTRRGGGAISNSGVLQGFETAFTRNVVVSTNASGGAIESSGTVDLTRSLIAYNDARFASAMRNLTDASFSLKNSTLFDNFCTAVCSGGPASVISTFGPMQLRFVTFAGHSEGSAILSRGTSGELNLSNSLFVDNSIGACSRSINSVGGNVLEGNCAFNYSLATADEDFVDVDVRAFGALDDRGGYTPVYPISPPSEGSSLFDATDKSFLPPWPFFDQRGEGFERRVDGDGDGEAQADPGAYEYSS